jgi:hypothetical protein
LSRIHGLCSTDTTPFGGPMFRPAVRAGHGDRAAPVAPVTTGLRPYFSRIPPTSGQATGCCHGC